MSEHGTYCCETCRAEGWRCPAPCARPCCAATQPEQGTASVDRAGRRMTYPKCELCGHQFRLPCAATTGCGCVGAFDDDYWKDGAQ